MGTGDKPHLTKPVGKVRIATSACKVRIVSYFYNLTLFLVDVESSTKLKISALKIINLRKVTYLRSI